MEDNGNVVYLCLMFNAFGAFRSIARATSGRGMGPGNLDFFGPKKWLDAISQGPKKSLFPGPNPLPFLLPLHAKIVITFLCLPCSREN
jgi:hypothetical protein